MLSKYVELRSDERPLGASPWVSFCSGGRGVGWYRSSNSAINPALRTGTLWGRCFGEVGN